MKNQKKKIKVSFDFDGTLTTDEVEEYAKELSKNSHIEVWIVTRRYSEDGPKDKNDHWWINIGDKNWLEVYEVAERINVPKDRIVFRNMQSKSDWFKENQDFLWHLDDDKEEINEMRLTREVLTHPICCKIDNWKVVCENCVQIVIDNDSCI